MRWAFNLIIQRDCMQSRHWGTREIISAVLSIIIAVVTFIILKSVLEARDIDNVIPRIGICVVPLLICIVFTMATSLKAWFSSPDAFYLTTCPFPVARMYRYHFVDACLRFLKMFGHLVLPSLLAVGWVMGGLSGILLALLSFGLSLAMAVNTGFICIFFVGSAGISLMRVSGAIFMVASIIAGLIVTGLDRSASMTAFLILLTVLTFWLTPRYLEHAFPGFQERAMGGAGIRTNPVVQQLLERLILFNPLLPQVFRAILYRELTNDLRNTIFMWKYAGVSAIFFLYIPLSNLELVSQAGITGALLFCFLVFASSILESYITVFAKEGDRIVFILPQFSSIQASLAKFAAAILEMLPLIILAWLVVSSQWQWSGLEALTVLLSLLLMIAVQVAATIFLTSKHLHLENFNFSLWEGMIYEQVLGNVDSSITRSYLSLQVVPAAMVLAVWLLHTALQGTALLTALWYWNSGLLLTTILILYTGQRLFTLRLTALLK